MWYAVCVESACLEDRELVPHTTQSSTIQVLVDYSRTQGAPKPFFFFFLFFGLFRAAPMVCGSSRPGVESEPQPATAAAAAAQDLSLICDLHHSSRQCQILNPLSEARDWILVFMDTSHIHFRCATMGTPLLDDFQGVFQSFTIFSSARLFPLIQLTLIWV